MSALILGIETSCDETAAAVVENGTRVLSNVIDSQISIHRIYGGVVPEVAGRRHIEKIDSVTACALESAGITLSDLAAVAVTAGPGLVGALLTGLSFAKALAYAIDKPLIGTHHIESHICANFLDNPGFSPPFVALVASGGHTHLVHVKDYTEYVTLGATRDDAAGEAFDKAARALGLPYPGGVEIDKLSRVGNPDAISFPRALSGDGLDFSFSGLKSAVLNHINKAKMRGETLNAADIAASFTKAVVSVLCEKSIRAIELTGTKRFALAGGVAANSALRAALAQCCLDIGVEFCVPPPIFCTDNAAMVAARAFHDYKQGLKHTMSLNAFPSLAIGERF